MIRPLTKPATRPILSRGSCSRCAILALAIASLLVTTACDEEAAGRAFRDAAATNLESGVKSITDGIIEGMFAAFDIGTDQPSDTGDGAASGG